MPQKLSKTRKQQIKARSEKTITPTPPRQPTLIIAEYNKRLKKEINRGFNLVKKELFPLLKDDIERLDVEARADILDDSDKINTALDLILEQFFGSKVTVGRPNLTKYTFNVAKKLVEPMQGKVNDFNKNQFTRQFKQISGVDPLQFDPGLNEILKVSGQQNVEKIVTQSSNYFDQIREQTNLALRKGTSAKELTDDIIKLTGTTENRARLIATDQIQKLNADLEAGRQQNNGITRYIWHDRNNARVRPDHADLDGAIFDWNFPPVTVTTGKRAGERNHPGTDINCKCSASPVIADITGIFDEAILAAEKKTAKLISEGRVPGYQLPKRKNKAA